MGPSTSATWEHSKSWTGGWKKNEGRKAYAKAEGSTDGEWKQWWDLSSNARRKAPKSKWEWSTKWSTPSLRKTPRQWTLGERATWTDLQDKGEIILLQIIKAMVPEQTLAKYEEELENKRKATAGGNNRKSRRTRT